VGYRPSNLLPDFSQNQDGSAPKNRYKLSTRHENFILNNQIIIAVSCSCIMKNIATLNSEDGKVTMGWFAGEQRGEFPGRKGHSYFMIPEGIGGLFFGR
jgi:hypothetical protein